VYDTLAHGGEDEDAEDLQHDVGGVGVDLDSASETSAKIQLSGSQCSRSFERLV
jgi:hypothetical protein